jgi:RNase P subunit RPR2
MMCPKCRSQRLRKSTSGNARLVFPLPLFMVWVRCHNCGWRFCRFGLFPGRKFSGVTHRGEAAA